MSDLGTFEFAKDWISKLGKAYYDLRSKRRDEIELISDVFGDPEMLARYYIEPKCQTLNPADQDEEDPIGDVRSPVMDFFKEFFGRELRDLDGRRQIFVLSDAGMGKTSLLVMLKLAHLNAFWPSDYECVLMKLDSESVDGIRRITKKNRKILLLDGLDEDPCAWNSINKRIAELLVETENFYRVIITCRTQFFPVANLDPIERPGKIEVAGYRCPMIYISPFDNRQIEKYLRRRFPSGWRGIVGQTSPKFKKALKLIHQMKSLRCRPMLLAHVEDLMESSAGFKTNIVFMMNSSMSGCNVRSGKESRLGNSTGLPRLCSGRHAAASLCTCRKKVCGKSI